MRRLYKIISCKNIKDHDKDIACVYITGTIMSYIAARFVLIQSRKPSIDAANYQKAIEKLEPCRLNNKGWLKVNHDNPSCKTL